MTVARVRTKRRSRESWQALLAGFESSGLNVEQYCRREGVSPASFYRWRTEINAAGNEPSSTPRPLARANGFISLGSVALTGEASSRSQPALPPGRLDLRLDLGDGLVLHLVRP